MGTVRTVVTALVVGLGAQGASAATLTGVARDAETRQPLGFVTVQVLGTSKLGRDVSRGAIAGRTGRYAVPDIPLGRFLVRFTRIGYETLEDSLFVTDPAGEYARDATMVVKPVPVDKVIVEAERFVGDRDIQPGFVDLEAKRLAELPGIIEGDPIRSLQLLPGVQAVSDISSGLYIRGGGPDQTLVLLDDVPVYNPTHAFGFFSTFNADALDGVTLYKGAYPARLGGRLGAVLDARSRDGNGKGVRGRAGVSTIASRLAIEGPVAGGTWMLSGRRTYLEPILRALDSDENPVPSYYFYDLNAKVSTARTGRGQLTLGGYMGRDVVDFDLDRDSAINLRWGNTNLLASYTNLFADGLLASARVSMSDYESTTRVEVFTTPIVVHNRITDATAGGEIKWELGRTHQLTGGGAATHYDVSYDQDFNNDNQIDYRRKPYELSAFVEDEWKPRGGTVVRGGLRARYLEDGGRALWEPRLSGAQQLGEKWKLKFGGGLYHQYLQLVTTEGFSAADFYVPIDDTAPPSRSWQAVGGVEWKPSARYGVQLEAYYTGLADLVIFDTNSPQPEGVDLTAEDLFYTGGKGYATGLELFVEKKTGAVTGWLGYTLGWTRRKFAELNQGKTFPPKYDRRHDLSVVGEYRRGRWSFGATLVYATGQAFTPPSARYAIRNPVTGNYVGNTQLLPSEKNSARLLPYHRLDLSVRRQFGAWGKKGHWFVQVFNVYSRRNEWFVQYDPDEADADPSIARQLPLIPSLGVEVDL